MNIKSYYTYSVIHLKTEKYVDEEFLDAVCTLFKNMFCNPEMDKEVAKGKAIIDDFKVIYSWNWSSVCMHVLILSLLSLLITNI